MSVSRHLGGAITLAAGFRRFSAGARVGEAIHPGLKLVVVLSGAMTIQLAGRPLVALDGPAVLLILSNVEVDREQIFSVDKPYSFVLVDIAPDIVTRELGVDVRSLLEVGSDGLGVLSRAATKSEQAVASQLLPTGNDQSQSLFRLAKALELVAILIDSLRRPRRGGSSRRMLPPDLDRIHAARDHLLANLGVAPDVTSLAASVGLNSRKLGGGFRAVFGATPYAYLQEERLQAAHRRLVTGATSISEVAYEVGYSPAHLATLFRRRFGIPPSGLVAGRTRAEPVLQPDKVAPTK